ncbi:MAG: glucose-6-phosphate dehydrogenase [Candidatus Marinimicrobia bacterium]|nr:glucose-6-phosphate dehydrogenase [Candidatus Neomarinimicrobiota bacterium]
MKKPENSIFVIFGGTGDLAKRKIIPALYQNYIQGLLPEKFVIVGLGRTEYNNDSYRDIFREWIQDQSQMEEFLKLVSFQKLQVDTGDDFFALKEYLDHLHLESESPKNYLFYLAVGPDLFGPIVNNLGRAGLCGKSKSTGWRRLIVEKPFGKDWVSARQLNHTLLQYFDEEDIYRIDHYLGKETVQNILAFRFANGIFEPLWNRNYIDHIEITGAESDGVGKRGGYYDQSGHMRDMVQNHLLQILATIAMEPPNNFESKAVRDEKVKIFEALASIDINNIENNVIRGQYSLLTMDGNKIKGYLQEDKVPSGSKTETFVAMKIFIDNWRWSGVPFYIRTGKRLPSRVNEVVIHFKKTPHHLFTSSKNISHNKLILRIQPDEGIVMNFGMKKPGEGFQIKNVSMDFHYSDLTSKSLPDAYERLLLDVLNGDPTLYARNDAVEACWRYIDPILKEWQTNDAIGLYSYPAGSWGPVEASRLFENKDQSWHNPCPSLTAKGENCNV